MIGGILNWRLPSLDEIKDKPRYLGDCCLIDGVEHVWQDGRWHNLREAMQVTFNIQDSSTS